MICISSLYTSFVGCCSVSPADGTLNIVRENVVVVAIMAIFNRFILGFLLHSAYE